MSKTARGVAAIFVVGFGLGSYGAGCIDRDPAKATSYERCSSELEAAPCSDGTECLIVNPYGGGETPGSGQLCTEECDTTADCPLAEGFEVACESFVSGRRCVVSCGSAESAECPPDLYCNDTRRQNGQDVRVCS